MCRINLPPSADFGHHIIFAVVVATGFAGFAGIFAVVIATGFAGVFAVSIACVVVLA